MSYRQGQIDALYKLGLFRSPDEALIAHALAGAAAGGATGYYAGPENHSIASGILGGAVGGLTGLSLKGHLNDRRSLAAQPTFGALTKRINDAQGLLDNPQSALPLGTGMLYRKKKLKEITEEAAREHAAAMAERDALHATVSKSKSGIL